jgi:hypothetical protein
MTLMSLMVVALAGWINEPEGEPAEEGEVGCRERLGGLLCHYSGRGMKSTISIFGQYGVDFEDVRKVIEEEFGTGGVAEVPPCFP